VFRLTMSLAERRNVLALLWGALAGAIVTASLEVLWTVSDPLLPWKILRRQVSYPPRHLADFILVAFATQLVLVTLVGPFVAYMARRWICNWHWRKAFTAGYSVSLSCVAFLFGAVWINLLTRGNPFAATAVKRVLILAAAVIATGLVTNMLLGREVRGWRSALAWSVLPSGILVTAAYLVHMTILFPVDLSDGLRVAARRPLPTIIFVTIDTLRADHVGVYASTAPATPVLDHLASQGVRFNQAIVQVPHTTPSHVSIFTSTYPFIHGARNGLRMRVNLEALPQSLCRLGYHTAAFVSAYTTKGNVTGLRASFDEYHDSLTPWFQLPPVSGMEQLCIYRILDRLAGNQIPAPVVNKRLAAWLAAEPTKPLFVWIHYFDPHIYDPPVLYRRKYGVHGETTASDRKALYRGEVEFCDSQLGEMLEIFRTKGYLDGAVVIVTSDHGESFLEPHPHVEWGHGMRLYDATLTVPLIWWSPGRFAAGRVVDYQVESVDIAPTILDILGAPIPSTFQGHSFLPLLLGKNVAWDEEAFSQTYALGVPRLFSLRTRGMKLILDSDSSELEAFNLRNDPGETRNVASERTEELESLRARLGAILRSIPRDSSYELDNETIQRLRSLGYLQ
jgi:arylsulfatase A-like enzyme